MIRVLYFARLREALGCAEETLAQTPEHVAALLQFLQARDQHWQLALSNNVLCAVNQTLARPDTLLHDGDEVAFFPPVTGG